MAEKTLSFGYPFFVRVIIPGAYSATLLLLIVWPLPWLHRVLDPSNQARLGLFFGVATIALGLFLSLADEPIYRMYEGWNWPSWLEKLFLDGIKLKRWYIPGLRGLDWKMQRRWKEWQNKEKEWKSQRATADEVRKKKIDKERSKAWEWLNRFPQTSERKPYALFPTILGNVLYAYEEYPSVRYGMDVWFYWHRLWLKLDDKTRQEIDKLWAPADALLYLSFASFLGFVVFLAMWIGMVIGILLPSPLVVISPDVPNLHLLWGSPLLPLLFLGWFFYYLSIPHHVSNGELLKSVFDVYRKDIEHIRTTPSQAEEERWKWEATQRYLMYGPEPSTQAESNPTGPASSSDSSTKAPKISTNDS